MRIGCFGINANPPHLGHRGAAEAFLHSGLVDRVWLVPTFEHAFGKVDVAAWEHRVSMCRLLEDQGLGIWASLAECEMRELEAYRQYGKSYTIYSLQYLRNKYPKFEFFWCVCSDIVTSGSYKRWHRWEDLEREQKILVSERSGYPLPQGALPKPFARVRKTYRDISSTRIRFMIRGGMDVAEYTGPKIAEYIRKHKLYIAKEA